jgi:hypothetical protein
MSIDCRIIVCVGLALSAGTASADNVDLSTVPSRDTVQLTIYNSEDLTLVRETRHVTFRKGMNPLQFSWANTLIDPTSVDLRFRSHADKLDILDTTFPHDRPQMLYWNVASALDGEAVVEISYFTSGITWAADYVCVSDSAEERMSFEGFVRIANNSGEDYPDASVRLVVGTINLVEKVADLARRGVISEEDARDYKLGRKRMNEFEPRARRELADAVGESMAAAGNRPKEIIKQGLSEYFIYTIEGTETIRHSWSKRMRLFEGTRVPFAVKYRYRPAEYGHQLVRLYVLRNDEASELGTTPLPDGTVRVFRDNGRDGLSYLVARPTKYVPIGQEIEVNLGVDPNVVHERVRLRDWRDNFWFQGRRPNVYFNTRQGHIIQPNYSVAGWDDHQRWAERIRNDTGKPIDVEFRLSFSGDVVFESDLEPHLHDYRSPQFSTVIAAGTERDLLYEVTFRQGINRKQDRVELE